MLPSKFFYILLCALLVAQILPCLASPDSHQSVAQRHTLSQRRFLDANEDPYADLYDYKDFPTDDSPDDGSALVIKGVTDEDPDGDGVGDVNISDSRANGLLPLGTHGGRVPYPTKDPLPPTNDTVTDAGRGVEGIGGGDVWWRNNSGNGTAAPPSSSPPGPAGGDSSPGENQQKQEQGTTGSSDGTSSSGTSGGGGSSTSGFSINGLPEGASIGIVVACCLGGILLILGSLLVLRTYFIGRVVPSGTAHKGKAVMIEDEEEGPGSPSSIRTA